MYIIYWGRTECCRMHPRRIWFFWRGTLTKAKDVIVGILYYDYSKCSTENKLVSINQII